MFHIAIFHPLAILLHSLTAPLLVFIRCFIVLYPSGVPGFAHLFALFHGLRIVRIT